MNIDIRIRKGRATVFKANQVPLVDGIDTLNTIARKYGILDDLETMRRQSKETQRKLRKSREKMYGM